MPEPMSNEVGAFGDIENDKAFMEKDVENDQNSKEDDGSSEPGTQPEEKKPSDEPEGEGEPKAKAEGEPEGESEPSVPLHRVRQLTKTISELRAQISEKQEKPREDMSEDELRDLEADKYLEKKLDKLLAKRQEQEASQDDQDAEELVALMDTYGEFDVDRVLDIKDEFKKVGTKLSSEGALKILFDRQKNPSRAPAGHPSNAKSKVPQPKTTAPVTDHKTPNVIGRPLSEVLEEAKKEYGLK